MKQNTHGQPQLYLRWTLNERIQHWFLAISFILLVFTGFALKYPETWWAWPFVFASNTIDLRSFLHRLAATVTMALGLYHIGYLIFAERGRQQWRALMLRWQDFRDMRQQILHNLGKAPSEPRYGHFTYWEKLEYWALIWGTVVMAVTGLMLWFENISLRFLPLWALDIATVIHFYEAILATFAIIVWHFYFVIFNPNTYPINFSMFNGHLTHEEMEMEHAGELERIRQAQRSKDKNLQEDGTQSHETEPTHEQKK